MKSIVLFVSGFLLAYQQTAPEAATLGSAPEETAEYSRVDASFSDIPIDTALGQVRDRLSVIGTEDCFGLGECEWHDADMVRHYFWTDGHDEPWLVIKSVQAAEIDDASIGALGIGEARLKAAVLANVRQFAPQLEISCMAEGEGELCGGTVLPGWIRIWFDESGMLQEVRFDGYHFT